MTPARATPLPQPSDWAESIDSSISRPILLGVVTLVAFCATFLYWASSAPLSSAAVATGTIVAEDRNIRVQHLEGGIVAVAAVREGDRVEKGAPLVTLDRRSAEAVLARLESRLDVLWAQEARLIAERDESDAIVFPSNLLERGRKPAIADLMRDQSDEYRARRSRYEAETSILLERIGSLEREIAGVEADMAASSEQLSVVAEEIAVVERLFEQNLTSIQRLLALRREAAGFRGEVGNATAKIAALQRNVTEVREQMESARTSRLEKSLENLTEVRSEIADIERQQTAAADAVARIVVRAPAAGIVVKLDAATPGAVLPAGGLVAEILPRDARQLVELKLAPQDIDVVYVGQNAGLRLTALDRRTTPVVEGTVKYISADRLIDVDSGTAYYAVRLTIDEPLPPEVERSDLYPGMQVEAYVRTGERTFLGWLVRPIVDSFARAFRSQ